MYRSVYKVEENVLEKLPACTKKQPTKQAHRQLHIHAHNYSKCTLYAMLFRIVLLVLFHFKFALFFINIFNK